MAKCIFRNNQRECLEPLYFRIFIYCCSFVWKQGKLEPKVILFLDLNIAILYEGTRCCVYLFFHKSCEFTVIPPICLCLADLSGPKRAWTVSRMTCTQSACPCRQPEIREAVSPPSSYNAEHAVCINPLITPQSASAETFHIHFDKKIIGM